MNVLVVLICACTSLGLGVVYLCLRAESRDDYRRGFEAGKRAGWNDAMGEKLERWEVREHEHGKADW